MGWFFNSKRCKSGTHRKEGRCIKTNFKSQRESSLSKSQSRPLKTIIPYFGGKTKVSSKIISKLPKDYDTYVEPFIGGGSVYWRETKAKKYIINDKDKEIYRLYKTAKNSPSSVKSCDIRKASKNKFNSIKGKSNKSACDIMYLYKQSYGATGKNFTNKGHIQNNNFTQEHAEKLKKTKVLNQDFKSVVSKYKGSSKNVIYLDPPYVKGGENYKTHGVTPKEVCDSVKNARAKVIISYDKNPEVMKACKNKGLKFNTISFKYSDPKNGGVSNKLKKELLITNY